MGADWTAAVHERKLDADERTMDRRGKINAKLGAGLATLALGAALLGFAVPGLTTVDRPRALFPNAPGSLASAERVSSDSSGSVAASSALVADVSSPPEGVTERVDAAPIERFPRNENLAGLTVLVLNGGVPFAGAHVWLDGIGEAVAGPNTRRRDRSGVPRANTTRESAVTSDTGARVDGDDAVWVTDADGRVYVGVRPFNLWCVYARTADGLRGGMVHVSAPPRGARVEATVALEASDTARYVHVRVVAEKASGFAAHAPVVGATLRSERSIGTAAKTPFLPTHTTSDADGSAILHWLEGTDLVVEAQGFATRRLEWSDVLLPDPAHARAEARVVGAKPRGTVLSRSVDDGRSLIATQDGEIIWVSSGSIADRTRPAAEPLVGVLPLSAVAHASAADAARSRAIPLELARTGTLEGSFGAPWARGGTVTIRFHPKSGADRVAGDAKIRSIDARVDDAGAWRVADLPAQLPPDPARLLGEPPSSGTFSVTWRSASGDLGQGFVAETRALESGETRALADPWPVGAPLHVLARHQGRLLPVGTRVELQRHTETWPDCATEDQRMLLLRRGDPNDLRRFATVATPGILFVEHLPPGQYILLTTDRGTPRRGRIDHHARGSDEAVLEVEFVD